MTQSDLDRHLQHVRRDGFTVLRGLTRAHVQGWRAAILDRYGIDRKSPMDLLAERPELVLPYVTHPDLLDLLEGLMGPFVGLAGSGALVEPSCAEDRARRERVWHRDMWPLPGWTDDYLPPDGVNVLTYLQGGEAAGPLRVLPGSHRGRRGIPDDAVQQPHPDELAVRVEPGDTVAVHSCTLHSGAGNFSGAERILVYAFFTKCWLPTEGDHDNAEIRRLLDDARRRDDRRVVRLFAPDRAELIDRAKQFHAHRPDGCSISQEEMWRRWIAEDRAALNAAAAKIESGSTR